MAAKTFSIEFEGYWRDVNKSGLSNKSGLYCVYSCIYNTTKETVTINKLIYIGESNNVNSRVANHEKYDKWKSYLKSNEVLCFSFGDVSSVYRERCEAALIFKHKPPVNTEYVNSFPFDTTTMKLSEQIALLSNSFTIYRT